LNFKNWGYLEILVQGDKRLFNPYGVMLVNPQRQPHVKSADERGFIEWVTSLKGKRQIAGYRIDDQQVFFTYGN
jgi:tungstate transport system substrate-binding protein